MITAGIKELKNQLSRYISFVKKGEDILITERGKVIARIINEGSIKNTIIEDIYPLFIRGLIKLPSRDIIKKFDVPPEISGKPVSEIALRDRR